MVNRCSLDTLRDRVVPRTNIPCSKQGRQHVHPATRPPLWFHPVKFAAGKIQLFRRHQDTSAAATLAVPTTLRGSTARILAPPLTRVPVFTFSSASAGI